MVAAAVAVGAVVDGGVVAASVLPAGTRDDCVAALSPPSPSLQAASAAVIVPARNPRRVIRLAISSTVDLRVVAPAPDRPCNERRCEQQARGPGVAGLV